MSDVKINGLPKRIYLCLGDFTDYIEDNETDFSEFGSREDICWCEDQLERTDPAYVLEADHDAALLLARKRIEALEAALAGYKGLVAGCELIAVQDRSGCRCCQAVIAAIVTEQPAFLRLESGMETKGEQT